MIFAWNHAFDDTSMKLGTNNLNTHHSMKKTLATRGSGVAAVFQDGRHFSHVKHKKSTTYPSFLDVIANFDVSLFVEFFYMIK